MDESFEKSIKTIIDASYAINRIYQRMANLDKKGKKNSKEYKDLLKQLNIMQEVEDIYYAKIDNKIKSFYQFLYECDVIDINELDTLIIDRISNYLIHRSETSTDKDSKDFFQNYYKKQLKELEIKDKNLSIKKMSLIEKYVLENVLNTHLYLLDLKSKQNKELINEKYNIFNMYKHKEQEFINNNFETKDIYHISYETLADYFQIKKETCIKYINSIIKREFNSILENMLNKEVEYNDELKQINEECFARSLFTFADSKTIDELNELFHNTIDKNNLSEEYDYYIDLITKAFKSIKRDRTKVKVLTIGIRTKS